MNLPHEDYIINSLERGLEALLAFLDKPFLSFSDFVNVTNLNKATAKRVLYTLEKNEFIKFNETNNKYSLGIRLFELGTALSENFQLLKIAQPYMEKISNDVWETTILAQRVGNEQIYLFKNENEGTVHLDTLIGRRRPLYYGIGKTILAFLPSDEQASCIPENMPNFTFKTISNRSDYLESLIKIQEIGYAIDDEEFIDGVVGIGVPIFQNKNEICGLIGVVGPSVRMTCEKREDVIKYLMKASKTISYRLINGVEPLI